MACDSLGAVCAVTCYLSYAWGHRLPICAAGILICEVSSSCRACMLMQAHFLLGSMLLMQGEERDVAEFVQRLRALRWKAMAVRFELLQSGLDALSEG